MTPEQHKQRLQTKINNNLATAEKLIKRIERDIHLRDKLTTKEKT